MEPDKRLSGAVVARNLRYLKQHKNASFLMKTTLVLDDDVLAVVRSIAKRQQKRLGAVVSMLLRQALTHGSTTTAPTVFRNGVPLLPVQPGARLVTLEIVDRLHNQLL